MSDDTRAHYERLADRYNDNWVYNATFVHWMNRLILDRLDIRPTDQIADIGCGTGLYSKGLAERANRVLCVDPSAKMLEQLPSSDALIPIQASAEKIISGEVSMPYDEFDAILIKEAIHHVRDRASVLSGLAHRLRPGGRILVVMLPVHIDYPLFAAALELFERIQPDPNDVAAALRSAGLQVDLRYESFGLSLEKSRYLNMVRSRYMSLLSSFDRAELEQGIAEINNKYPTETLEFVDRQAFVLGKRG
jgi:SAM-dependent methyltransferase